MFRIYVQSVQIDSLTKENNALRNEISNIANKIDKILSIVEDKLGAYVPTENPEEDEPREEIIDDFITLKERLDCKSFVDFAIEFISSNAEKSYEIFRNNPTIDDKTKKAYKSKFNKQKKAISTLQIFMNDIPIKPDNLYELGIWKGNITVCVNDAVKKLKCFVTKHDMKRKTKRNEISITFMCDKDNIDFFKNHLEEINKDEGVDVCEGVSNANLTVEEQFENAFQDNTLATEV